MALGLDYAHAYLSFGARPTFNHDADAANKRQPLQITRTREAE